MARHHLSHIVRKHDIFFYIQTTKVQMSCAIMQADQSLNFFWAAESSYIRTFKPIASIGWFVSDLVANP